MKNKQITLIVGAGAVENSWTPVEKAIRKTLKIEKEQEIDANFIFARHVYIMRTSKYKASKNKYSFDEKKIASNLLEQTKADVTELKKNITSELKKAQNNQEIKPRKELDYIIKKFITPYSNSTALISANWDEVIDTELQNLLNNKNVDCFHIHGSISNPDTLYLPSEITDENYREGNEQGKMENNHGALIQAIENDNRTILYGISLDPLDAELSEILAAGWKHAPNLKEIIIINPEHKKIAIRIKSLLDDSSKIKIIGYRPEQFTSYN